MAPQTPRPRALLSLIDALIFGVVAAAWAGLRAMPIAWLPLTGVVLTAVSIRIATGRLTALQTRPVASTMVGASLTIIVCVSWPSWASEPNAFMRLMVALAAIFLREAWCAFSAIAAGRGSAVSKDLLRISLLGMLSLATWWAYFTPQLVGVVDERWYGDIMEEFAQRVREGRWPVWAGEGPLAWNGNVHHFRSAPWQNHLGALFDLFTLRQLSPIALNHLTVVASQQIAPLILFAGLRRLRPASPWLAFGAAALYATSPAMTLPQILHDMYMATMSMPFHIIALIAAIRLIDAPNTRFAPWLLGASLGVMWLCHPPEALLAAFAAAAMLLAAIVDSPSPKPWLLAGTKAAIIFGLTVVGHFRSLAEFRWTLFYTDPVTTVFIPAVASVVLLWSAAWLGRIRNPTAWELGGALGCWAVATMALWEFWRPFAFAVIIVSMAIGAANRWPRKAPSLVMTLAVLGIALWFGSSRPLEESVRIAIAGAEEFVPQYFKPVLVGGVHRPGLAVWAVGLIVLLAAWRIQRPSDRAVALTSGAFLISVVPVTPATKLLWSATPEMVREILHLIDPLRIWLGTVPLMIVGGFLVFSTWNFRSRAVRWATGCIAVAAAIWTGMEHIKVIQRSWAYRQSAAETARLLRPELRTIHYWHYDLLPAPATLSAGISDPRLETRLHSVIGGEGELINPDIMAQAMEAKEAGVFPLTARWSEAAPDWLYFTPQIRIAPGERKVLRFNWSDKVLDGWLILRGPRGFYRDYRLPSYGLERAFGAGPLSHHTLTIVNSTTEVMDLTLEYKREGAAAREPFRETDSMGNVTVSTWSDDLSPVRIERWSPLQLLVTAPADGWLETFRSWQPGYVATVDNSPVKVRRTKGGLVSVPVPAGQHRVVVDFTGTPALRLAWAATIAGVSGALTMIAIGAWRLLRTPGASVPPSR